MYLIVIKRPGYEVSYVRRTGEGSLLTPYLVQARQFHSREEAEQKAARLTLTTVNGHVFKVYPVPEWMID